MCDKLANEGVADPEPESDEELKEVVIANMNEHPIDSLNHVAGTTYTRHTEEWGGCNEYISYAG
jgi:hypothetical protein